jgi:protein-disulfide isomerase
MNNIFIYIFFFLTVMIPIHLRAEMRAVPTETLDALYSTGPSFGDADGQTIVEFFDYQCGYCKAAEEGVTRLLQEDLSLRIIYMDFPKLGLLSITAATAVLASLRQGADKYLWFHHALMNKDTRVTDESLYQVAASGGLNVEQLRRDMSDPTIAQYVESSVALGQAAGVRVTPSSILFWVPAI